MCSPTLENDLTIVFVSPYLPAHENGLTYICIFHAYYSLFFGENLILKDATCLEEWSTGFKYVLLKGNIRTIYWVKCLREFAKKKV